MFYIKKEYKKKEKKYLAFVRDAIQKQVEKAKSSGELIKKEELPERMNSYELNLVIPFLTDEYLIKNIEYCINQSFDTHRRSDKYTIEDVYSDALNHKYLHVLLDRFKKKIGQKSD